MFTRQLLAIPVDGGLLIAEKVTAAIFHHEEVYVAISIAIYSYRILYSCIRTYIVIEIFRSD